MTANSFVINADKLASVRLDADGALKREPRRPPAERQPGFEDTFDFHTLFYDCFRLSDTCVRFIGPPLFNLETALQAADLDLGDTKGTVGSLDGVVQHPMYRTFSLDVESIGDSFILTLPEGACFNGTVQPSCNPSFAGQNVLMTMIKHDPLVWLQDWTEFYVKAHGVDGVLIYNNQAPDYSSADIAAALRDIDDLKTVAVIDWFFPYGPGAGSSGKWDSAFAQVGAMEHARFRFLAQARTMINADVDELVFCHNGGDTICALAHTSDSGYLCYPSRWATAFRGAQHGAPVSERRFRDSYFINPNQAPHNSKWTIVPARVPAAFELSIHDVPCAENDAARAASVSYRHLPEFNTGWKGNRAIGANMTEADEVMQRTFERIGWL